MAVSNINVGAMILTESGKGSRKIIKEVMDELVDNGLFHGAPNNNTGRKIANEMQKLMHARTTIHTLWINYGWNLQRVEALIFAKSMPMPMATNLSTHW